MPTSLSLSINISKRSDRSNKRLALSERSESKGYTLIELLIVISILAILSVVAFVNFKGFSKDQAVIKATSDIQSALRFAQTNATSGTTCAGVGGAGWSAQLRSNRIDIYCDKSSSAQKTFPLENTSISSVRCSDSGFNVAIPLTVSYSPLYGQVTFSGNESCLTSTPSLAVTIINLQNASSTKTMTISRGGSIDVQ